MQNINKLGNYLRMYRKRGAFTPAELAYLLGCKDRSNVSRYERDERAPSLEKLIAYDVICGATLQELFPGRYERVAKGVHDRARQLSRRIDSKPFTPVNKQKFDALVEITHPSDRRRAA